MDKDIPQSQYENQTILDMDLEIVEDIPEELEDFIFLSRLGLFEDAEDLFNRNLSTYLASFPVLVEYADMLLQRRSFEKLSEILATLPAVANFSAEQEVLLGLMKALSDVNVVLEPDKAQEQSDETISKLRAALLLAENWHNNVQRDPRHFSEIEIHTLEIYLSILLLLSAFVIDEKYFQPPQFNEHSEDRWDGFLKWCFILIEKGQFWEAQMIFTNLVPVLYPSVIRENKYVAVSECSDTFSRYLYSLKDTRFTDATATAELAATNAYISWILKEMEQTSQCCIPSMVYDEVTRAKFLSVYLFGEDFKVQRGRLWDWQQNLLKLQRLERQREEDLWDDVRKPLSWAAEKGHRDIVQLLLNNRVNPDEGPLPDPTERKREMGYDGWGPRTPLSWASEAGNTELVILLLEWKANPDSIARNGRTPLSYAASSGHNGIIELLLEEDVDPDSRDKLGWTPLTWAAAKGHEHTVKLLLEHNADPHSRSKSQATPVFMAAQNGHTHVIKLLLRSMVDLDLRDEVHRTPLSYAAAGGYIDTVEMLLGEKVDPDSWDEDMRTPLSYAAEHGHKMVVERLLKAEVNPDFQDTNKRTPLSHAAFRGHLLIVQMLLTKNADPCSKDSSSHTPLSRAAENGHEDVMKLLLTKETSRSLFQEHTFWEGLLLKAAEKGRLGVITLLLDYNTHPDPVDGNGWTPLLYAAAKGHNDVVGLLLATNSVDLSKTDPSYKRTSLLWATRYGQMKVVTRLLGAGLNPDARDNFGQTPLSLAAEYGHSSLVVLLLQRNADPHIMDNRGWRPLSWAKEKGHQDIMDLLSETNADADADAS